MHRSPSARRRRRRIINPQVLRFNLRTNAVDRITRRTGECCTSSKAGIRRGRGRNNEDETRSGDDGCEKCIDADG